MKTSWKASWIWTTAEPEKPNVYVFFRKTFNIPALKKGSRAILHATAGHFCRLYLNGKLVARGPDRCYFREKIFHSYDVAALLRKGNNLLAAHCYFLGRSEESRMERHAAGPAGFIAQLEINGRVALKTDETWKAAYDDSYAVTTEVPVFLREWREEFFAEKAPRNWQSLNFDDKAWPAAKIVAPAEGGPWTKLVPKETPEMTKEMLAPLNMHLTNAGGSRDPEYDGFHFYNILGGRPVRGPGDFKVWNGKHQIQEILFDMGRVVAGYPVINIVASLGGTIKIYYGDSLSMLHWDTIHLGKGPLTWSPFTLRGGRYFRLDISGARNPVSIRSVRWVRTNYPARQRGGFTCSDERLNKIWKMCALTADTCAMEHITDCVGREQTLWMMDFRFQAPQHYYCFGDTALARRCFGQFAAIQLANGHILGYGPSARPLEEFLSKRFPDRPFDCAQDRPRDWFGFNFFFLIAAWEYYEFTGEKAFLRQFYPVLKKCAGYYARSERQGFADLGAVRGSYFVDWGYEGYINSEKCLYSYHQALYYGALKAYAAFCRALGKNAEAGSIERKARRLEERFFRVFVDRKTGRVIDCIAEGKRYDKKTIYPAIAVLRFFDRIPEKIRRACLKILVERKAVMPKTGIGGALAVEALFRHGRNAEAVKLISDFWGAMVDAGLPQVPELYDMLNTPKGADSRWAPVYSHCHSYASLADVLLQQHVLGARVEGHRVRLAPFFGNLRWASGVVPTVHGDVRISWKRTAKGIEVTARGPEKVEHPAASRGASLLASAEPPAKPGRNPAKPKTLFLPVAASSAELARLRRAESHRASWRRRVEISFEPVAGEQNVNFRRLC